MAEPRDRYSTVSLFLHWTTAALVVTQLILISLVENGDSDMRGFWMTGHKSVGLTILVLTLARLAWRIANPAIPLPERTPGWQKLAARGTHVLFYVLLLAMPLAGWAASSAAGRTVQFFGLFPWPDLPMPADRGLAKDIMEVHETAGMLLIALVVLHILGGLKHYIVDRDGVLNRMLPFLPRRAA